MSQPVGMHLGTYVIAAGTTVLSDEAGRVVRLVFPGTFVGSVELYDSRTTAGTAAGNNMYNVGLPLLNQYRNVELGFPFKKGLTVVATGTPTCAIIWDK